MFCTSPQAMDYTDNAIDMIHYMVDRAQRLMELGMKAEAGDLMQRAGEIAKELRKEGSTPVKAS